MRRQEQALVDAYEADGWRGAAREKVKPIAEILRAKASISKYRQELRLAVKFCDEAGVLGREDNCADLPMR